MNGVSHYATPPTQQSHNMGDEVLHKLVSLK